MCYDLARLSNLLYYLQYCCHNLPQICTSYSTRQHITVVAGLPELPGYCTVFGSIILQFELQRTTCCLLILWNTSVQAVLLQ